MAAPTPKADRVLNGRRLEIERFGEDILGLVLAFLPLKDKLRLRCVSQMWKRALFERQHNLIIRSHNFAHGLPQDYLIVGHHMPSDIHYSTNRPLIPHRPLAIVLSCCIRLWSIKFCFFGNNPAITERVLNVVADANLPELIDIGMTAMGLASNDAWSQFLNRCRAKQRNITYFYFGYDRIFDFIHLVDGFEFITNRRLELTRPLPELKTLVLPPGFIVPRLDLFEAFVYYAPNLTHIEIGFIDDFDFEEFPTLETLKTLKIGTTRRPSELNILATKLPRLRELRVTFHNILLCNKIRSLRQSRELRTLIIKVRQCRIHTGGQAIYPILVNHPKLLTLKIGFVARMDNEFYRKLFEYAIRQDARMGFTCYERDPQNCLRGLHVPEGLDLKLLVVRD